MKKLLIVMLFIPGVLFAQPAELIGKLLQNTYGIPKMEFQNKTSFDINVSRILYTNDTAMYNDEGSEELLRSRPIGVNFGAKPVYRFRSKNELDRAYFETGASHPNSTTFDKDRKHFISFGYHVSRAPRLGRYSFDKTTGWDKTALVIAEYAAKGLGAFSSNVGFAANIGGAAVIEFSKKEWKKIKKSVGKTVSFTKDIKFYTREFNVSVTHKKERMQRQIQVLEKKFNDNTITKKEKKELAALVEKLENHLYNGGQSLSKRDALYILKDSSTDPELGKLVNQKVKITCSATRKSKADRSGNDGKKITCVLEHSDEVLTDSNSSNIMTQEDAQRISGKELEDSKQSLVVSSTSTIEE